jgi:hypothetical protein
MVSLPTNVENYHQRIKNKVVNNQYPSTNNQIITNIQIPTTLFDY